jgi:hypothetical protein
MTYDSPADDIPSVQFCARSGNSLRRYHGNITETLQIRPAYHVCSQGNEAVFACFDEASDHGTSPDQTFALAGCALLACITSQHHAGPAARNLILPRSNIIHKDAVFSTKIEDHLRRNRLLPRSQGRWLLQRGRSEGGLPGGRGLRMNCWTCACALRNAESAPERLVWVLRLRVRPVLEPPPDLQKTVQVLVGVEPL